MELSYFLEMFQKTDSLKKAVSEIWCMDSKIEFS